MSRSPLNQQVDGRWFDPEMLGVQGIGWHQPIYSPQDLADWLTPGFEHRGPVGPDLELSSGIYSTRGTRAGPAADGAGSVPAVAAETTRLPLRTRLPLTRSSQTHTASSRKSTGLGFGHAVATACP